MKTSSSFKVDFHPWTIHLLDGRTISKQQSPASPFSEIIRVRDQIAVFTVHLEGRDVSVRPTDGAFNLGDGWVYHPEHVKLELYPLLYSRGCEGDLSGHARVTHYRLGYHATPDRFVVVRPGGVSEWHIF